MTALSLDYQAVLASLAPARDPAGVRGTSGRGVCGGAVPLNDRLALEHEPVTSADAPGIGQCLGVR